MATEQVGINGQPDVDSRRWIDYPILKPDPMLWAWPFAFILIINAFLVCLFNLRTGPICWHQIPGVQLSTSFASATLHGPALPRCVLPTLPSAAGWQIDSLFMCLVEGWQKKDLLSPQVQGNSVHGTLGFANYPKKNFCDTPHFCHSSNLTVWAKPSKCCTNPAAVGSQESSGTLATASSKVSSAAAAR